MSDELAGKVVWITGAARGIGAAIAGAALAEGATVLATDIAPESEVKLDPAPRLLYRRCDVTNLSDIERTARYCGDELGGLGVLVNNAGVLSRKNLFDVTWEDWDRMIDTNLKGTFFCSQAAAKIMVQIGRKGCIVNVGSMASELVRPNTVPYCASKGGVRTLTFALAVALAPHGIRVNAVAPGSIYSDLSPERWAQPGELERVAAEVPLGRVGQPEDIAGSVIFLASDRAAYVTGAILGVHGGRVLVG